MFLIVTMIILLCLFIQYESFTRNDVFVGQTVSLLNEVPEKIHSYLFRQNDLVDPQMHS